MAGITLETAEAKLQQYLDAEAKIMAGQSYTIGSIHYSRADLAAVQKGIELWNARCQQLAGTGIRVAEVIPR